MKQVTELTQKLSIRQKNLLENIFQEIKIPLLEKATIIECFPA